MTDGALKALAHLQFNYTPTKNDVWSPPSFHVDGLHPRVVSTLLDGLAAADQSTGSSPIGVAIQGQRGSGKTHLLSWVREMTQLRGGYFFLVSLLDAGTFWRSTAASVLDGLHQPVADGHTQAELFVHRLADLVELPTPSRLALRGQAPLTAGVLDDLGGAVHARHRRIGSAARDTLRALTLFAVGDHRVQDVAQSYLIGAGEAEPGERATWGIRSDGRLLPEIISDVSRLFALTGPTVIAVDQIDGLIAQCAKQNAGAAGHQQTGDENWQLAVTLDQVASGLMDLREATARTLTVLAALPTSWQLIRTIAVDTVQDRFRETPILETIPDAAVGRSLVERRLAAHYGKVGFTPPYPTWPVRPEAFDRAPEFTPRQLLVNVERHIRSCVLNAEAQEMSSLSAAVAATKPPTRVIPADTPSLRAIDDRYAELCAQAEVGNVLASANEDSDVPPLLSAGLDAWIRETGDADYHQDSPPGKRPRLHARLRRTLDDSTGDEAHWAFIAIAATHHNRELSQLRNACEAAGVAFGVPQRRLFLLRNEPWEKTPKRRKAYADFVAAGGQTLPVTEEDLRRLAGLRALLAEEPADLPIWLADRRPASRIPVLAAALGDQSGPASMHSRPLPSSPAPTTAAPAAVGEGTTSEVGQADRPAAASTARPDGPGIRIGHDFDRGDAAYVELAALRKHTAIFAGSGSGKTVLIRRLVEECALHGVSAIVLDPNNDLARLGDAWPSAPDGWGSTDAEAAREYLDSTDIVVWTPGRAAGQPLTFQPLPDFSSVIDDPDEFTQAVEVAVAALAPRAQVAGTTAKAARGQAVLRQALRHYAHQGDPTTLSGLVALLNDLPEGVSDLAGAAGIAAELGLNIEAARINDPLFGGTGESADPGLLLTPRPGRRARVSVISFVGLPGDAARQSFVNQLQMSIFSWIKRHPARDRPLAGLLVMDEAQTLAPSGQNTPCTQSTLMLASQARKYGLGLVFATQAPKALHPQIPGNAATQFFGLLNAPVHIEAAREMARFKGGDVPDISRLRTGQFYAAVEGSAFRKLRTPLCLTHHPASPLTTEEVLTRAHPTRPTS